MRRRSLLRALAVGAAGLAGCASASDERGPPPTRPPTATESPRPTTTQTPPPTPPPTPTPSPFVEGLQASITEVTFVQGEGSLLAAKVPVENTTDAALEADLVLTIEADTERTERKIISVPPGATKTVTLTFDVFYGEATKDGQPVARDLLLLKTDI